MPNIAVIKRPDAAGLDIEGAAQLAPYIRTERNSKKASVNA